MHAVASSTLDRKPVHVHTQPSLSLTQRAMKCVASTGGKRGSFLPPRQPTSSPGHCEKWVALLVCSQEAVGNMCTNKHRMPGKQATTEGCSNDRPCTHMLLVSHRQQHSGRQWQNTGLGYTTSKTTSQ